MKDKYKNKVKEIIDNHYVFYANDVNDMKNCLKYLFNYYSNYLEYERLTYPCHVLIYTCSEKDDYENYYEDRVYVENLNVFLSKINNTMKENKNEK